MTEYVVLPIQDENGEATNRSLRIDTRYFLGESAEVANRYIEMINTDEVEREAIEVEYLDRVVHDLPTNNNWLGHALSRRDRNNPWREYNEQLSIGGDDVAAIYPKMEWRTLDEFCGYQMNKNRTIIDKETQKTVAQTPKSNGTGLRVVLFHGPTASLKMMDVDILFKKTFPELNQ